MFIAALICLILGILLLGVSVYLFFKLDVRDALRFIRNKRTGRSVVSSKQRVRPGLKSSGKAKVDNKRKQKKKLFTTKIAEDEGSIQSNEDSNFSAYEPQEGDSESATSILSEDSENPTGILNEESENPTGLLEEDSESPTGLLEEDSESPTGLLEEDSESPTGLLEEESENPTGLLEDDSEKPTGLLFEESETPTGILSEGSEEPTGILDESDVITSKKDIKKNSKKVKTVDSDFKFDVIKEIVVVHTNETIE